MSLFSVPYNGYDVDTFLCELNKRIDHINDVYCELPKIQSCKTMSLQSLDFLDYEQYSKNCEEFLIKTMNTDLQRYVTLNAINYYKKYDDYQLMYMIDVICKKIEKYKIQGIIVANQTIASCVKDAFPNIKISISTNANLYTLNETRKWKLIGSDFLTPPRDMNRNINYLKMIKKAGFKIRLMLNEACSMFCNNYSMCGKARGKRGCLDPSHWLQRTYIIPRWLDILDEYVDVYKYAGRFSRTEHIFKSLDCYISRKDCTLKDLFDQKGTKLFGDFNTSEIPDKLIYCNCEECDTCNVCSSIYEKYPYLNDKSRSLITLNE